MVGLLLAQIFFCNLLQQCGDVELNPGPPKPDPRQTRLTSKSGEGGMGRRESVDRQPKGASAEPSLTDIMSKLVDMDSSIDRKLEGLREEFNNVCSNVRAEMQELKEEMNELRNENDDLRNENKDLRSHLHDVDLKLDDLECRSRRNNLLLYGLSKPDDKETNQELESRVQEIFTDNLELSETVTFDRVHRLNGKSNSPVIMRCTFFKEKLNVLKAKAKLQGSDMFIGEDFSLRVRTIRKALAPHLKEAKKAGKMATMIHDYLLIDGKKFVLDSDGSGVREVQRSNNK
jgi:predicted RNase H-like nuclease (RuvC/YqgF family)